MANYKVPRVRGVRRRPAASTPPARWSRTSSAGARARTHPGLRREPDPSPTGSRRCRTCGSSSSGCGWPPRRPRRCWPTGAPTSIKVESPTGDPMRNVFGSIGIGGDLPNPAFALDNRGKRSVVLDLRDPEGRRAPGGAPGHGRRLRQQPAARRPRQARPRGRGDGRPPPPPRLLQHQRLRPPRRGPQPPDLRHRCLLGPVRDCLARWPTSDGNPLNARGGIGDHITGLAALSGILGAVLEQRRHGSGPGGRGLAAAHRRLRARLGPGTPDAAGQGGRRPSPGTTTSRR